MTFKHCHSSGNSHTYEWYQLKLWIKFNTSGESTVWLMFVLWMGCGWAYLFFSLFILWLLTDVSHTVFIMVKYVFFIFLGMWDKGLRIFSLSHAREKMQKRKICFSFAELKNSNLSYSNFIISGWRIWYWIN